MTLFRSALAVLFTILPVAGASKEALEAYLNRTFPGEVTEVSVGKDRVRLEGKVGPGNGAILLADIPMDVELDDPRSFEMLIEVTPEADGRFGQDVPRHRQRGGRDYDRLTSRWQIVRRTDNGIEPASHARYPLQVECRSPDLPSAKLNNKKGLGGWHTGHLPDEIDELGLSAVTVNVMIHSLVSLEARNGTVPFQWQGRTYHANEQALARLDARFLEAQQHGLMVSAILLIPNPARDRGAVVEFLGHPDATKEGIFAMPNVTSEEGLALYGAILNLMAERWSRPEGKYGRVHHWILHNEVDAGWEWTNAGDKDAVAYMDLYQRSMRLAYLIARQFDPESRPFISLTHHWGHPGNEHWYGARRLVELLLDFGRAEGDFPWAMAYHPYPQDLGNPRTWEDGQAAFDFNTAKITPKNLEVLDAYMKRSELLFQGTLRPVHLSENGFNSPDYSPKSLEDQAAGMAYAWKKIQALTSIQSWQYHNWVDNRHEGGLRIGLRKFPDDAEEPLGRKPIWHLYQALGTTREDEVAAPYLKTIGIQAWNEILHRETIQ